MSLPKFVIDREETSETQYIYVYIYIYGNYIVTCAVWTGALTATSVELQ